ncbi:MAG: hypothetical protein FWG68_08025 [Defluviitaleaceae bacterium]|nr:hypothetical protein [Defluviitaleaceae bacterium]
MKSSIGSVNIGGSSILVIFVLLCLTTFATLAMVSATANYRISARTAEASTAYYAADSYAEELLAQISLIVNTENDLNIIEQRLSELGATLEGNIISYTVPIDEVLYMEIQLEMTNPGLRIIAWVMNADYDPELFGTDGLNVWPG